MRIAVAGKLEFNYGFKRMTNPYLEVLDGGGAAEPAWSSPCTPPPRSYRQRGCAGSWATRWRPYAGLHRSAAAGAACEVPPHEPRRGAVAPSTSRAAMDEAAEARRRLVYEELLLLELMLMQEVARAHAPGASPSSTWWTARAWPRSPRRCPSSSPTSRRGRATTSSPPSPRRTTANHLLLGDVGTGKTVVAGHRAGRCRRHGRRRLCSWRPPRCSRASTARAWGRCSEGAGVSLGGAHRLHALPPSARPLLARVAAGEVDVLVGTHALLRGRRAAASAHPRGHRRAAALRRGSTGEAAGEGRGARRAVPHGHAHPALRWRWRSSATSPCPTSSTARTTARARTTRVLSREAAAATPSTPARAALAAASRCTWCARSWAGRRGA